VQNQKSGAARRRTADFFKCADGRKHEGMEEEKEEERVVLHDLSRTCAFSGDRGICWSCVSVGGPLLAPTQLASATNSPSVVSGSGEHLGSRYKTNTALLVFDGAESAIRSGTKCDLSCIRRCNGRFLCAVRRRAPQTPS
jgi:hypothetical protein